MNLPQIDSTQEKIKMNKALNNQETTALEILGSCVGLRSACPCGLDPIGTYCTGRGKDFDFTRSGNVETRRSGCDCKHRTQV